MEWKKEGENDSDMGGKKMNSINKSRGKDRKIKRKAKVMENNKETSKLLCALSGLQLYFEWQQERVES